MTRFAIAALLTLALSHLGVAGPALAHHSIQAQFDINKSFSISGTVAKVEYINPHSYLTLNVKDADGTITKWAFEMAAAAQLRRNGLSRADRGGLKPGDEVTVTALAARDGSNTGLLRELKAADGRILVTSEPNAQ
jgi:hypothetical protein